MKKQTQFCEIVKNLELQSWTTDTAIYTQPSLIFGVCFELCLQLFNFVKEVCDIIEVIFWKF